MSNFIKKLLFLIIVFASLFFLGPAIFVGFPLLLSSIPFFNSHQFFGTVVSGILIAISYGLIAFIIVFLIKRLTSKNKLQ